MWDLIDKDFQSRRRRARADVMLSPQEKGKRFYLHLKRVPAEVRVGRLLRAPLVYDARVLSIDFLPGGVRVFMDRPLPEGTQVSLTISDGSKLFVKGIVRDCRRYTLDGKILRDHPYPYRITIIFKFENNGEKETVKRFSDEFFNKYAKGLIF